MLCQVDLGPKSLGSGAVGGLNIASLCMWRFSRRPSRLAKPFSPGWCGVGGGGWYREKEATASLFSFSLLFGKKACEVICLKEPVPENRTIWHPTNAMKIQHFWESLLFAAQGVQMRSGKVAGGFSPWVIFFLYFYFFYFLTTQREQLNCILLGRFEGCLPRKMLKSEWQSQWNNISPYENNL